MPGYNKQFKLDSYRMFNSCSYYFFYYRCYIEKKYFDKNENGYYNLYSKSTDGHLFLRYEVSPIYVLFSSESNSNNTNNTNNASIVLGICIPIGIILVGFGIFLFIRWRKRKNAEIDFSKNDNMISLTESNKN